MGFGYVWMTRKTTRVHIQRTKFQEEEIMSRISRQIVLVCSRAIRSPGGHVSVTKDSYIPGNIEHGDVLDFSNTSESCLLRKVETSTKTKFSLLPADQGPLSVRPQLIVLHVLPHHRTGTT